MTKRKGKNGVGCQNEICSGIPVMNRNLARSKTPVIAYWNRISLKSTKNWLPGKNTTMVQKPRFHSDDSGETEKESNVTKWQKKPPAQKKTVCYGRYGWNPWIWTILCPIKNLLQKKHLPKGMAKHKHLCWHLLDKSIQ
jgi:hypothetical protein